MSMKMIELSRAARMAVEKCMNVRPGETVCVLTDTNKVSIAEALCSAANSLGAETVMLIMTPRQTHGNEPPKNLAAAMKASDVVIAATTYAITHTEARVQASKAGARVLILRGITEDIMLGDAMQADYDEVKRITQKVADVLTKGDVVEVTSKKGTDVRLSVRGRKGLVLAGFYDPDTGFAVLPDGEAPIAPVENSVNGTIVFDYSVDSIGLLSQPVTLKVNSGVVMDVSGGIEAEKLRGIIESADSNANQIAEFAVGTNPRARLTGNLAEDKKRLGSVHFAIGDNHGIGGVTRSSIHLDGLMIHPTVIVDGKKIVDEGRVAL